jgi:hypothetical protein
MEERNNMKIWIKVLIVFIGGGLCWGLAFCASVWPAYAMVLASLSAASTATVGILTGFKPTA